MSEFVQLLERLVGTAPDYFLGVLLLIVSQFPVPQALGQLVSYLVDVLKLPGIVKDGDAAKWNFFLSFAAALIVGWFIRAGVPALQTDNAVTIITEVLAIILAISRTSQLAREAFVQRKQAGLAYSLTAQRKQLVREAQARKQKG